jgi:two-component system LytT family sensor kinase
MNRRTLWRSFVISSLFAAALYSYLVFSETGMVSLEGNGRYALIYLVLISNACAISLLSIRGALDRRAGRATGVKNRFPVTLAVNLGLMVLHALVSGWVFAELFYRDLGTGEFLALYSDAAMKLVIILILSTIVYSLADFAMFAIRRFYMLRLEAERVKREQMNLQFEALKSQLRPHFLFNSLNTVSSLIYRSAHHTEEFIRNLTTTYRSVLKNYRYQLIPLDEELNMVRAYSGLMSVRFEDSYEADIDVKDELPYLVPPLSIQMLLENAVKHNRFSPDNPLHINVFIEGKFIVVRNNFIGQPGYVSVDNNLVQNPDSDKKGPGLGLENIRRRYRYLAGKEIIVRKNDYFTVSLPLLDA